MHVRILAYPSLGQLVTVEVSAAVDDPDGCEGPLRFWGRTARVPHDVDLASERDLLAYVGERLIELAYEPIRVPSGD